jgi:hypothetical protein
MLDMLIKTVLEIQVAGDAERFATRAGVEVGS